MIAEMDQDADVVLEEAKEVAEDAKKVETTQRVETSDETVMDDVSNQGRMIAEMDQDADVVLEEAKESRALKRLNETPVKKAAKRQKLDKEVEELKRHIQIVPNEDDDVYTDATPLARKIITFTTTQLILLVEMKYPLTRFTLDQMLNAVRLKVKDESEVSLELLSFRVDAAKELKKNKDLVLPSQVDDVD
uniref:Protein kinase-like domain, phloem protein 2-like protein n=1 Tax=Tanacetum cinerariifolium TaxID=118510 RepID=A0A6L2LDF6_TANCI|nr:protein kinase-like domain, phloem protein 2-like protein [Tanacetum cinerariifolium]